MILEDSPYRLVSPGSPLPTLKSQDRAGWSCTWGRTRRRFFPAPGSASSWPISASSTTSGRTTLLADELAKIKSMVTVNTSSLSQAVVAGALLAAGGRISELNAKPAGYYGDAMQATLRQLDRRLPAAAGSGWACAGTAPPAGSSSPCRSPFETDEAGADPRGPQPRRDLDPDALLLPRRRRRTARCACPRAT